MVGLSLVWGSARLQERNGGDIALRRGRLLGARPLWVLRAGLLSILLSILLPARVAIRLP
jgi:hypothetical protein